MSTDKILGDQYRVGGVIGHGAYSVVYECTDIITHNRYAVKVLNKAQVRRSDMEEAFEREAMALKSLTQCPFVTRAVDILQSTRNYYVVMDLADRGSLLQHVVKTNGGRGLPPPAVRRYFQQMMQGLRHMHSLDIVHRDIKPENLLLDQWRAVKISDFGFAAKAGVERRLYRQCGTPQYVAPEVLHSTDGYVGQYADIWSAGVTLYVMLCGQLPFAAHDNDRLYELIQVGDYPPPKRADGLAPVCPSALHLLRCCLDVDPQRRWTAERILKHPFLQGLDDICAPSSLLGPMTSLNELGASVDPDAIDSLLVASTSQSIMPASGGEVAKSHSCPNLLEIERLGIDIFNDPQLGRKRKRPLRKFFESTEGLSDLASASADVPQSLDEMEGGTPSSSPMPGGIDREGLGRRGALQTLKQTSEPLSPRMGGANATPHSQPGHSRGPSQGGFETPPLGRRPASGGAGSRPSTTPHDPVRFAKPVQRRFQLVHIWLFAQFVLVLIIVTVVALLKIMFDVRVNKLPLPKKVKVMVENLIDTAGFGAAPNPTSPSASGAAPSGSSTNANTSTASTPQRQRDATKPKTE